MSGETVSLSRPLDFVAMTDHAESFGLFDACASDSLTSEQRAYCDELDNPSLTFFANLRAQGERRPPQRPLATCDSEADCVALENTTWARIVAAARQFNSPGEFTAFAAYEYSPPLPEAGKVHRNVIFRNDTVPTHAVSAFDAVTVLDLWRSLEATCAAPCDVLTIPHNMNKTWGIAYSGHTIDGDPYSTEDWALRGRSEPLAEIFQAKGSSECGLVAGAVDEECTFEQIMPRCDEGQTIGCAGSDSFARDGLKKGLQLGASLGFNPLRFGIVAATDTHNGNPGNTEEWNYRGTNGLFGSPADKRMAAPKAGYRSGIMRNPGGLTAVWAEDNTRDLLFDALERRETYGTSGTRIALRFFAGSELPADLTSDPNWLGTAYALATPMGGVLTSASSPPKFYVRAQRDPFGAPLQRIQMVKGWVENGETKEQAQDIACAQGAPDSSGHCPDAGPRVDVSSCEVSEAAGSAELETLWVDESFDAKQDSFYYVRVLEAESCRWSTFDALRLGVAPRDDVPATIHERAWSSPIWYRSGS